MTRASFSSWGGPFQDLKGPVVRPENIVEALDDGGAFDVGETLLELDLVGTEGVLEQPGRFVFADCRPVGRVGLLFQFLDMVADADRGVLVIGAGANDLAVGLGDEE